MEEDAPMHADDRYFHRAELADILRKQHGYPVTKNMLDKAAHFGHGPTPAGRWGKFVLYTLPEGLRWARSRFRSLTRDR
jgi:hypothetical protein